MSVPDTTSAAQSSGFPIAGWLKGYDRAWLRWDLIAALTTWALVVPQAIAYAQIAGMSAQAGIFTAFAGLLVYALLGTSRQLIVTPMSAIAAISAATVAPLATDPAHYAALSSALAILAGALMICFGILKLGFISQFIALSVQVGLMFGLGMTIIATQIPKILGIPEVDGNFIDQVVNIVQGLSGTNYYALILGLLSFLALFFMGRLMPKLPAALIVVVVSLIVVTLFNLPAKGVDVLGIIDRQIPLPRIPGISWNDVGTLFAAAFGAALIMYAESDTVAEEFATEHRYDIKPNRELLALGAANIGAGFFQGFITGGGASQSAANNTAGAKSQLSGLIVSALVFITAIALMPLFTDLAQSVLAAIVINAVLGFINVKAIRRFWTLSHSSFWISMVALFGVLLFGMLPGLLLAVFLSFGIFFYKTAQPDLEPLGVLPDGSVHILATHANATPFPDDLLAVRVVSSVNAANVKHVRRELQELAVSANPSVVLLDLELTNKLDVESVDVLEALRADLAYRNVELWLGRVHATLLPMLNNSGLADKIGPDHLYPSSEAALAAWKTGHDAADHADTSPTNLPE